MNKLVEQFISLINANTTLIANDDIFFKELVEADLKDFKTLTDFVIENKHILEEVIVKDVTVFDYFYEKSLNMTGHKLQDSWLEIFLRIVKSLPDYSPIKESEYYIIKLQQTGISYNEIFKILFENGFNVGDPEELIYTVIARGEKHKIKTISDLYIIEDYLCIFDVAIRHGRSEIIEYFIKTLDLNTELFGKILEFENLKLFSYEDVLNDNVKNFLESVKLILQDYKYPITLKTINIWCDIMNENPSETKEWEKQLLLLLKSKIKDKSIFDSGFADFGRFNHILLNISSKRDSSATGLKDLCENNVALQDQLIDMQMKYSSLLDKYYIIKDQLDSLTV